MTKTVTNSRRDLRERAFQALFAMESGLDILEAGRFAYIYDKDEADNCDVPVFLLQLVHGVTEHKEELDTLIEGYLKKGWTLSRLTLIDRTLLRLGLYEIKFYEETPDRVALNEIIEVAKKYSDESSSKFVNGLLRQFLVEA